ncbi:predicted protein [Sclerotinia sclerotiorum 1980 UF-70]|uniref:Uncharacterized protein n=4 Tax=Sclerotinia TaxID=5179 RepID=A0A1D9QKL4_SCLS1|nr:predicted protein [Sclerotinia sclerotiorum 1980 UF-70]APA15484.1 hypothetical protein sscle_15g102540 [Sclerotinia sclerotiorum 1980 UF-70]EDN98557.1 predicted protein [Sclerotinia sclerotiorum 1980 UF-70]KAJ8063280.1 hypothetical protein OCU04_008511 [Sclerotinia nivalis]CAD6446928.1 df1d21d4-4bc1-4e29-a4c6-f3d5540fa78c [Sclerotinia trifoliorum]
MYFSYTPSPPSTSYSTSSAMEIPSSSSSRPQSPSCAFPSWPRRSSMNSTNSIDAQTQNYSYTSSAFSDEELSCGLYPSVFEEEDCSPLATPNIRSPSGSMCEPQYVVVDNAALMRELIAQHAAEKAKKKEKAAAEKSKKRHGSSSRKSRHSSGANSSKHMTPIAEVGE